MNRSFKFLMPGVVLAAALGVTGCDVEQTEEGEMPDVEVQGGNMPEYDVEGPDVDVGTQEKTVTVPDVDVDIPDDGDAAEEDPGMGDPMLEGEGAEMGDPLLPQDAEPMNNQTGEPMDQDVEVIEPEQTP